MKPMQSQEYLFEGENLPTEYFAANSILEQIATLLKYEDFPIKFVPGDSEKAWFPRFREI